MVSERRNVLKGLAVLATTGGSGAWLAAAPASSVAASGTERGWQAFDVTTEVEVAGGPDETRLWLPIPLAADTPYQRSLGNAWSAEGAELRLAFDPVYGAGFLMARFPAGVAPRLQLTSSIATRGHAVPLSRRNAVVPLSGEERSRCLKATSLIPTDGIVRSTAEEIVRGEKGDLARARAIYEWIVENTFRDPKVRGCGPGDVKWMLESRNLGGKCADINALFVGLCRAAGIPARDVYGLRIADSTLGYKSLGKSGVVTRAQHCRAEFYAEGYGWVPVDPADVRKVVLEEDDGLPLDHAKVSAARRRLFGSWEMNWMAFNTAHDVALPSATGGPVGYLMYPQAEVGGKRLDSLEPDRFVYRITSRARTL